MTIFKRDKCQFAGRRSSLLHFSVAACISFSATLNADDTEIFFGQDTSQANVLFVLDVSGSMGATDGTTSTRLDKLKAALTELLSTTSDINVGLLSYESGGNVLHQEIKPVTENRGDMLSSIDSLTAGGGTPSVGALLEGGQYFRGEPLQGSGTTYPSPMQSACQSNHIVLLTDGQPTVNASADVEALLYTDGVTTCTAATPAGGTCGEELAGWLAATDHSDDLADTNGITTHTIGFNFSSDWLPGLSTAGGGQHFTADSASSLLTAFDSILEVATDSNNSFAAPAISLDQFSRLSHRDDMYLALFQPNNTLRWSGNLKRYRFDGKVKDKNDAVAIDPAAGTIKSDAHSFWSKKADGPVVTEGGAASLLDINNRNVYTYTGTNTTDLTSTVNALSELNDDITAAMLNIPDAERDNLLQWARGVDVDNEHNGQTRLHMGDPLHSRPAILTYGGDATNPETVVFIGTNEGYLHAIDSSDGAELYSFVPPELLENLDPYYKNERTINRIYGLDGDFTLWVDDKNLDGKITDTDHAYLYMGMRRGGRNYTALNVTKKNVPEFMWSINGGDTGFEKLGQSWSKPTLSKIVINGTVTNVLIFGGGYDPMQDNASIRSADTIGNDMFIVDAESGDLLWSTADDPTSYTAMQYSIPSDTRVVDMNGDGFADQIYVGDMGGQLWRFDIDNFATSAKPSVTGGVIADLSGPNGSDNRRFFYRPDVALVTDGHKQFLSVAVGSGNRAHPLQTSVNDRFYMVRQQSVFGAPEGYGILDKVNSTTTNKVYRAVTEADLYDATDNLIGSTDVTIASDARDDLKAKEGWLLSLTTSGEKVLAPSLTISSQVMFNTYVPETAARDDCSPAAGSGRTYSVSVLDATPTNGTTAADRSDPLLSPGIPPEPVPHIGEDGNLTVVVGVEEVDTPTVQLTRRVYWTEQPDY